MALSPSLVSAAVTDDDITYNVADAFLTDRRVTGSGITPTTVNGVVTLSGTCDNLAAKTYAVKEAKKINGVLAVIDKVAVTPSYRSDSDITHAVRRRILNSAVIQSQWISVVCKDGIVTLTGTVDSFPQEYEAGLLASEVRGVKEVKNYISTKWSKSRSDLEIRSDAFSVLGRDVYLTGMPLSVSVQDGIVTLSGTVGNAYEKDRAGDDVRWIDNVADLKNDISVDWSEDRGIKSNNETPSDDLLKQTVRKLLDQDSRLVADDITIRTSFGEVTLDGSVRSDYEKQIAGRDVKNIVGFAWLVNNLVVRGDEREDWAIQGDVDFNFDTDAVVEGFGLDVGVKRGIVTLTGKVNSWYQWSHAYDVASRVRGVRSVIDNIKVSETYDTNGSNWNRDANLTKSIKSRLRSDWTTWWVADKINVTVRSGVATIDGDVNTWNERAEAADRTLKTSGVLEVDNRLTIKGIAYPWDQHQFKLVSF